MAGAEITTMTQTRSFLGLPAELRMLIYRDLVPYKQIYLFDREDSRCPNIREDGGICAPALIAVNQLIRNEMFEAWFRIESAIYIIYIGQDSLTFLGRQYDAKSEIVLPSLLGRIKSLRVVMSGIPLDEHGTSHSILDH